MLFHIHRGHLVGLLLPYGLEYNKDVSEKYFSELAVFIEKEDNLKSLHYKEKADIFTKEIKDFI